MLEGCAEYFPSSVTAVHLSGFTRLPAAPAFTIGSMASTIPSFNRGFSFPAVDVIGDLRLFVHAGADAVAYKLPHNGKPVGGHVPLDGSTNIEQPVAWPHFIDGQLKRFARHIDQALEAFLGNLADRDGDCRIPVGIIR